jgi:hypothetical protein
MKRPSLPRRPFSFPFNPIIEGVASRSFAEVSDILGAIMYTAPCLELSDVNEQHLCLFQSQWGISMEQK